MHKLTHFFRRCLNLIIEKGQPLRDEVFKQLNEAGIAAWARGAHEVSLTMSSAPFSK